MEKDLEENTEFRIKWPRGQLGSFNSEQFMMIEDLYKHVEKYKHNQEMNMSNKVNIEFLRTTNKVLEDIEKLKDANREMKYTNGKRSYTMIERRSSLCMFINGEIKEHRIQTEGMAGCLKGKRDAERQNNEGVRYQYDNLSKGRNSRTILMAQSQSKKSSKTNKVAKHLRDRRYRQIVIKNKKAYDRKKI